VLAATPPSPTLPFVTSATAPEDVVRQLQSALSKVARAPKWAAVRAALMLGDIVPIAEDAYAMQLRYAREAAALGYPELE
jgi:ABC-type phosphate/phosphonate transport system substrate-binding protein